MTSWAAVAGADIDPLTPGSPAADLRITLTGGMAVACGDRIVADEATGLSRRQVRALLAALVLERHRAVPRDELASVLWSGGLPSTWETAVRGAVSRVRAVLVAAGFDGDVVASAFGSYQVRLPAGTVVDVEEADRLVAAAEGAAASGDAAGAAALADAAGVIAGRSFLPDLDSSWVQARRQELARVNVRAHQVASAAHRRLGHHQAAIEAGAAAIAADPYSEPAHRLLMAAHAAAGDRAGALRAYERCRALLRDDLGVDPTAETEAAYLALLGTEPTVPAAAGGPPLPFVGRDDELAVLGRAWEQALAGRTQVVLVAGEPGIGKTRLLHEFGRRAMAAGPLVLWTGNDQDLRIPYQPFVVALADEVRRHGPGAVAGVGPAAAELCRLWPDLPVWVPGLAPPPPAVGAGARWRLFDAVA